MDHIYAATTSTDIVVTPPPCLRACLLDHSFSRPTSDSPQVIADKIKQIMSAKVESEAKKSEESHQVLICSTDTGEKSPRLISQHKYPQPAYEKNANSKDTSSDNRDQNNERDNDDVASSTVGSLVQIEHPKGDKMVIVSADDKNTGQKTQSGSDLEKLSTRTICTRSQNLPQTKPLLTAEYKARAKTIKRNKSNNLNEKDTFEVTGSSCIGQVDGIAPNKVKELEREKSVQLVSEREPVEHKNFNQSRSKNDTVFPIGDNNGNSSDHSKSIQTSFKSEEKNATYDKTSTVTGNVSTQSLDTLSHDSMETEGHKDDSCTHLSVPTSKGSVEPNRNGNDKEQIHDSIGDDFMKMNETEGHKGDSCTSVPISKGSVESNRSGNDQERIHDLAGHDSMEMNETERCKDDSCTHLSVPISKGSTESHRRGNDQEQRHDSVGHDSMETAKTGVTVDKTAQQLSLPAGKKSLKSLRSATDQLDTAESNNGANETIHGNSVPVTKDVQSHQLADDSGFHSKLHHHSTNSSEKSVSFSVSKTLKTKKADVSSSATKINVRITRSNTTPGKNTSVTENDTALTTTATPSKNNTTLTKNTTPTKNYTISTKKGTTPVGNNAGDLGSRLVPGRKRSAATAGLDFSQFPSKHAVSWVSDTSSEETLTQSSSSTSTGPDTLRKSIASSTYIKPKVPRAGPNDLPLDIEKYILPLKGYGWKRELVMRGVYDETRLKFPPADVYYFTPEGKKLRSGVMVAAFLEENPTIPLSPYNFTFLKKTIFEEPWETVRQAGKSPGRPEGSFCKVKSSMSPKKKRDIKTRNTDKIKKGSLRARLATSSSAPKAPFISITSNPVSHFQSKQDEHSDSVESDDYDEEYDPLDENQTPKWNKTRSFFGRHKAARRLKPPANCEILIQSIPEPDIIIDRAEESFYVDENSSRIKTEANRSSEKEDQRDVAKDSAQCMMLLPDDIKQELQDSEEESDRNNKCSSGSHNQGENRIQLFSTKVFSSKPTARKSTMPRIALKKPSKKSKEPPKDLALSDGQLCSTSCPGLSGVAPSLQCCVCMCLFHHQCVSVGTKNTTSSFKCLRCRNSSSSMKNNSWPAEKQPFTTPSDVTRDTSSVNTPPVPQRKVFVRSSLPSTPVSIPPPAPSALPLPNQFMITRPTLIPIIPEALAAGPKTDAIHLLRNLTTVRPTHSVVQPPLKPGPVPPPQLIRGGVAPSNSNFQSSRLINPVTQSRLLPRLIAAPGVVASSSSQPPQSPMSMTVITSSASGVSTMAVSSGSQPLPQMIGQPWPQMTGQPQQQMIAQPQPQMIGQPQPQMIGRPQMIGQPQPQMIGQPQPQMIGQPQPLTVSQPQPQMMTLPASLLNRLNLSQPLAVKLNNAQVVVPPSCIISSQDGLKSTLSSVKVLLPPSTFPVPPNSSTKLSVTVSDNIITTSCSTPTTAISTSRDCQLSSTSPTASSQESVVNSCKECSDSGGSQVKKSRQRRSQSRMNLTPCAINRLHCGFDCMLAIFQYLGVQDLLRASQVCKTWLKITQQKCLWQKVNLKGVCVKSWDRAAEILNSNRTRALLLKNLQHGNDPNTDRVLSWNRITSVFSQLKSLQHIEFGLVPSYVLHAAAEEFSELQVLRAEHISDYCDEKMWTTKTRLDLGKFAHLTKLQELRLRGVASLALPTFTFSGSLAELASLQNLHTLSLTSLVALRDSEFCFLEDMKQLKVLELGDCLNWTSETYRLLGELSKLEHLRLECGGEIPDIGVGPAIAKLSRLKTLELILFAIPASLKDSLRQLPLLETLVLWPDTCQSLIPAVVNSHAVTAVVGLSQLKSLVWGVVIRQNSQEASAESPPALNTIPLLYPGATLDPEAERHEQDIMHLSVNQFTEKLLMSLPKSTSIKVFNTQMVGRDTT